MMNWIWLGLIIFSIICAGFTGKMSPLTTQSFVLAKDAVDIAIKLIGIMALWLGLMRVAQDGGLMHIIARALKKPMHWLFPDIPADHPAMHAMILNFGANILGLGNAATPFGIKAMIELNKLNKHKGTATNAMCLFLAINTSALALLPTGVIGTRVILGSNDPASIWLPTILATFMSTTVAIIAAKLLAKMRHFEVVIHDQQEKIKKEATLSADKQKIDDKLDDFSEPKEKASLDVLVFIYSVIAAFVVAAVWHYHNVWQAGKMDVSQIIMDFFSNWAIPALMGSILLFGLSRKVKVYESMIEGAKEGFQVAVRIIPYLVAIIVAVGMFKESGAMDLLEQSVGKVTEYLGMPVEALPMAIIRPLSGSGANAYMISILKESGPDSFVGQLVSVMQGSTETTLYVLAVYFGAVGITRVRHALAAGLIADLAGIIAAVAFCHLLL
jgi:spore maturation protein SpmA